MTETLRQRRAEIDEIDQQLLQLLNRRARLAEEIGQLKRAHNMPVADGNARGAGAATLAPAKPGPAGYARGGHHLPPHHARVAPPAGALA